MAQDGVPGDAWSDLARAYRCPLICSEHPQGESIGGYSQLKGILPYKTYLYQVKSKKCSVLHGCALECAKGMDDGLAATWASLEPSCRGDSNA